MDKVEKFKELLIEYGNVNECIGVSTSMSSLNVHYHKKDKLEKELLKMYVGKQEKPVIRCKELCVNIRPSYGFEIQFINLKNNEVKTYKGTLNCEEKYGTLITDDFIFVKEAINEQET